VTPDPETIRRLRTLDAEWTALAARHGFALRRDAASWVSYDGRGTISVAPDELLDADDTLAQIVLHELCHFAVEGEAAREWPDWGLDNTDDRHVAHEHAALVVQATLADRFGLRAALVATTDFRPWYEALPAHALDAPDPVAAALAERALTALAGTALETDLLALLARTRSCVTSAGGAPA
jgi:hypothetical protein